MQQVLSSDIDLDDLLDNLEFSADNVQAAALNQPKLLLAAGRLQVRKTREKSRAEAALRLRRTEVDQYHRKRARENGTKLTEAQIVAKIDRDAEVIRLQEEFDRAREEYEFAKLIVEAYHSRGSTIKVISSRETTEMVVGTRAAQTADNNRSVLASRRSAMQAKYPGAQ